jgi:hypothetical protein
MENVSSFLSRSGSMLRDFFNYLLPAVPFVTIFLFLLGPWKVPDLAWLKSSMGFLGESWYREIFAMIVVYTIGRLLYAVSIPLFKGLENVIKTIKWNWIKNYFGEPYAREVGTGDASRQSISQAKAILLGSDLYYFLFERTLLICASERVLGTGSFGISLLLLGLMVCRPAEYYCCSSVLLTILFLVVGVLMVFMYLASERHLRYAVVTVEKISGAPPPPSEEAIKMKLQSQ